MVLDTSVLVDSLTGEKRSAPALRRVFERGERILLPALVYYEWLRGPRLPQELALEERLFPRQSAIVFGLAEARLSAKLYGSVRHPRGREIDLAIAALRDGSGGGTVDLEPGRLQRYPRASAVWRCLTAPEAAAEAPLLQ